MTRKFSHSLPRLRLLQALAFITFILPLAQVAQAQSHAVISKVYFTVRNDSLFVMYDLGNAGKQERFDISLKITTASGKVIAAKTIAGDVGSNIAGGRAKQIVWNIGNDNIVIDEELAVEVLASPQVIPVKFVSRGMAVLLSAVVPGLGLTTLNKGGPYWIMAIGVYGAAAGSYLYYSMANQNYNKYLDARTEDERNSLHSTVQSEKTISNVLIYTAGAIWLGNMIWTLANPNKTKPANKGISFGGCYDPLTKAPVFTFKYVF